MDQLSVEKTKNKCWWWGLLLALSVGPKAWTSIAEGYWTAQMLSLSKGLHLRIALVDVSN